MDTKILKSDEWFEFENNFEEGWGGNPNVKCLANIQHHREVAAMAANELSKKYRDESDLWNKHPNDEGERIIQNAYDRAAKKLYPNEKLWTGDNSENPAFLKERIRAKESSLGLPNVGEMVELADWMDITQKKTSFEVIGVQRAAKVDRDFNDISHWLWVKDSKGEVHAATRTTDGKIGIDSTWTDFTDRKKHPYEKSLKDAGYSLSKAKGYWEISKEDK